MKGHKREPSAGISTFGNFAKQTGSPVTTGASIFPSGARAAKSDDLNGLSQDWDRLLLRRPCETAWTVLTTPPEHHSFHQKPTPGWNRTTGSIYLAAQQTLPQSLVHTRPLNAEAGAEEKDCCSWSTLPGPLLLGHRQDIKGHQRACSLSPVPQHTLREHTLTTLQENRESPLPSTGLMSQEEHKTDVWGPALSPLWANFHAPHWTD